MTVAKSLFEKSLESIEMLGALYDYLAPHLPDINSSELLRAQYVMVVSDLDYYIHNRVRDGLVDMFYDSSKNPPSICISLRIVKLLLQEQNKDEQKRILDAEVRNVLSKDSYQSSRNIENAFGLIGIKKIWSRIASVSCKNADDLKKTLNLIVLRRNKIAHESDINPITGNKELIDKNIVFETIAFIKMLVNELDKL